MDSKAFFQAVLDSSIPRRAGRLVLVTHIVPGSENFVLGIPLHGPTCRVIEELVPVIHYTRDMIASASPGGHRYVLQVNAQGNRFFLCNEGKSANFMHGGVVGPFIDLVQAELLFALSRIGDAPRDRVVELGDDAKRFISELWITRFSRQGAVH
ncbi:hypothetical protein M5C97_06955 [Acidovorax sp. NCPPB 3859]|nr:MULTISPECIES: hypothetical protein [unclassified Acidovorax]MDA8451890.1 hypothetical protein [Acidovorax sp. GBBC 3297]MDA8461336.1 hypothetical protein [Acidovorax sp. GBBC 3333]MDA8466369.1 hypothetical protein [Acidovorax sp. GBBC 3332]MDA8471405.1 hypothetical protein [Acidovorax sp. GBBC 3299]WCM80036.1 hypothetical protein M5C94_06950 [Acidovorax sp. GBBC 712]